ncbi:MAG: DNA-directed RNA polymerase subunit P [Aigarchaeota archaeon]|nr:DNA-directed RNA polymerase subunit P [Aigarchaeota archaeon]MCS7127122.1 DNA-directed RNA polymerase subunit P [Candidatus Calditenuaceae archaeon]MDW8043246.1 DNA-directed RNA polymerase subunit P [Nitrososphaerota archaeon]
MSKPGSTYQCLRCKSLFEADISPKAAQLKCPNCGFTVVRKPRPSVAKLVSSSKLSEEVKLFHT